MRRGITDFHVHINPWHLLKPDVDATMKRTQPRYAEFRSYAEDPQKFLRLMDEGAIERACLINYVAPDVMGYPPATNDWVAAYAKADRARLIPFGGFHPDYVKDAQKEAEDLIYKYEVGGVKFHGPHMLVPPHAYLEGSNALRILYETCERERVPIMFHTGTSIFPGARNRFGDPMPIDDVAVDFPKLKIVLAHAGRPIWMETARFLLRRHPNVWMDISSIPPAQLMKYYPDLERDGQRLLFGSDWPGPHVPGMRQNADAVDALPLSEETKKALFIDNAKKVLARA